MGDILVGTCSWTDPALLASGWYPTGARDPEGRLRHYASRFPVVEVDATYYALPSVRNSRLWAERTPAGFLFDVKAFSLLTGHPTRVGALPKDLRPAVDQRRLLRPGDLPAHVVDAVWSAFLDALAPLRDAGRLGGVLFQFPPWFAPGRRAEEYLEECRERTAGLPVAVEFRHPGWADPARLDRALAFLARREMAFVAVDTVQGHPASLPPVTAATCRAWSVVRFHGRSPRWADGSKEDRFRHRYGREELLAWVPRVRSLAERADAVHVLFNNCCGDAAVSAAGTMSELLGPAAARPLPAPRQEASQETLQDALEEASAEGAEA
ncbi:DUF72 domain-containing protein [Streptomyces sp. URMC 123]|uniref:DUF72 domain-containing protein n=1 Tax=Streptomyces sp. URMC 123 TaxID=3423403 RepID=UPI003F1CF233